MSYFSDSTIVTTFQGLGQYYQLLQIMDKSLWLHNYEIWSCQQRLKFQCEKTVWLEWHAVATELEESSRRSKQGFDIYTAGNQLALRVMLSYSITEIMKVAALFQQIIIF